MNIKIYVLLLAVVMIAFPLFIGWIPFFGEFIPKVAILFYVAIFAPCLLRNKAFAYLLIFHFYIILQSFFYGYDFDFVTNFAYFMNFALPIFLLQAAIVYDNDKTVNILAKFSFLYIFITVILSLFVMANDPTALRHQQALSIGGETSLVSLYRRYGLATYSFAAMIMCMPALLIHIFKSSSEKKIKILAAIGVVLSLAFMWMGQVTTTFLICLALTFVSLFIGEKTSNGILIGVVLFFFLILVLGESIIDTIQPYTRGTAMEQKFDMFSTMSQGGEVDSEDRYRVYLLGLTMKVFVSNPIFGDPHGYVGGHNFFLDRLALYGMVGFIPFALMYHNLYKMVVRYLPHKKHFVFRLLFIGYIALGILKNMSGLDYWLFMFCLYPFILKFSSRYE